MITLKKAQAFTAQSLQHLKPLFDRIAITGELRRQRPIIHSIRLLILPHKPKLTTGGLMPDEQIRLYLETTPGIGNLHGGPLVYDAPLLGEFEPTGIRIYFHICPYDQAHAFPAMLFDTTGPGEFKRIVARKAREQGHRLLAGHKSGTQASKEKLVIISNDEQNLYGLYAGELHPAAMDDGRDAWIISHLIARDEYEILKSLGIPTIEPQHRDEYAERFNPPVIPHKNKPMPEPPIHSLEPQQPDKKEKIMQPHQTDTIFPTDPDAISQSITKQWYSKVRPAMLSKANIPSSHASCTLDNWKAITPSAETTLATCRIIGTTQTQPDKRHLRGIYLSSAPQNNSTGKTHLLCGIARNIIENTQELHKYANPNSPPLVHFLPFEEYILQILYGWQRGRGESIVAMTNQLCEPHVLLIDDFACDGGRIDDVSPWIYTNLIHLLNTRIKNDKITCFSSNIPFDQLEHKYDARIKARIHDMIYDPRYGQFVAHDDVREIKCPKPNIK